MRYLCKVYVRARDLQLHISTDLVENPHVIHVVCNISLESTVVNARQVYC